MTAHTETPYTTTWATGGGLKPYAVEVYASDGTIVASIESEDRETAIANAEFIVKACNAHAILVETCQVLLEALQTGGDINKRSMPISGYTFVKMLKEALKKAEATNG